VRFSQQIWALAAGFNKFGAMLPAGSTDFAAGPRPLGAVDSLHSSVCGSMGAQAVQPLGVMHTMVHLLHIRPAELVNGAASKLLIGIEFGAQRQRHRGGGDMSNSTL
jgi:hypothetical protein